MIWAALIVLACIILTIRWRKRIFKTTIVGLILIALIIAFQVYYGKKQEEKKQFAGVILSAEYDPKTCPAYAPLKININNTTVRTVKAVTLQIDIYLKGYSENIGVPEVIKLPKIVNPQTKDHACQNIPKIFPTKLPTDPKNYNAADFDYKTNKLSVYFYERNEAPPIAK